MADDIVYICGFEKFGPPPNGQTFTSVPNPNFEQTNGNFLSYYHGQGFAQEWLGMNFVGNTRPVSTIVGLAGTGTALMMTGNSTTLQVASLNLPGNYSRIIVGFAFMTALNNGRVGIEMFDGATSQWWIGTNVTGQIEFGRGNIATNILYTSAGLFVANVRHYIEVDVTTHNTTGRYTIWLDGTQLTASASNQNTRVSANNYVNLLRLSAQSDCKAAWDDIYVRDNTGGTATAIGDVQVQGKYVEADDAVQFTKQQAAAGSLYVAQAPNTAAAPGANQIAVVPITPVANMTIQSIGLFPNATSATAKLKGVIYSDSGGAPNALLSDGTEVVGMTANAPLALPLATPVALTAGTQYWIGWYTDTSVAVWGSNSWSTLGQRKANTYGSGAPGTLTGMTTGQTTWCAWGICNTAASNAAAVKNSYPPIKPGENALIAWNQSSTVGHEDLFTVEDLTGIPAAVYTVQVSVLMSKDVPGPRTAKIRGKSGATTGDGTVTSFTPGINPQWFFTQFLVDPDTSAAWTPSAVNAFKVGYKLQA